MPRRPRRLIAGDLPPEVARRAPNASSYVVRASELGRWAYCERAWWLRYVADLPTPAEAEARLDAGTLRHAEHGRRMGLAGALWKIGLVCLAVAALAGLLWLLAAVPH